MLNSPEHFSAASDKMGDALAAPGQVSDGRIGDAFDTMKSQTEAIFSQVDTQAGIDPEEVNTLQESIDQKEESENAKLALQEIVNAAQEGDLQAITLLGRWANMKKGEFPWPNQVQRKSEGVLLEIIDDLEKQPKEVRDAAREALYPYTEDQKTYVEQLKSRTY